MSIQAVAPVGASSSGRVGIVLCSPRFILSHRRFSSLPPPTASSPSLSWPTSFLKRSFAKPHQLHPRLVVVGNAADSSSQPSTAPAKTIVSDEEFSLAKVSFGVIGLGVGLTLLSYGFGAYFNLLPGSEWSAIMLTYGFPLAIIGMALKVGHTNPLFGHYVSGFLIVMAHGKLYGGGFSSPPFLSASASLGQCGIQKGGSWYAELKPVPCITYSDAEMLRESCATPILKQVRNDVIRFRYGDEQHLDEALKRIFQYGQGGGIPRRNAPMLKMIREEVTRDGKYCLVLVFEAKALQLSDFEQRQAKFTSFFGPGITAEIGKGENDLYEVCLISNATLQPSV